MGEFLADWSDYSGQPSVIRLHTSHHLVPLYSTAGAGAGEGAEAGAGEGAEAGAGAGAGARAGAADAAAAAARGPTSSSYKGLWPLAKVFFALRAKKVYFCFILFRPI